MMKYNKEKLLSKNMMLYNKKIISLDDKHAFDKMIDSNGTFSDLTHEEKLLFSDQKIGILPVLVHIPHSGTNIPDEINRKFTIPTRAIKDELLSMTDHFTDQLFYSKSLVMRVNGLSRLVVDPERFRNDADEPMSLHGKGAIYTKTLQGIPLRELTKKESDDLLENYYDVYHNRLNYEVEQLIKYHDKCLIIDGHSFPSEPFSYEDNENEARPDFCIGTCSFHTPINIVNTVIEFFESNGYSVEVDFPFSGTMVPLPYYLADRRVSSIMIEVNRKLYMDESAGMKNGSFNTIRVLINDLMKAIANSYV